MEYSSLNFCRKDQIHVLEKRLGELESQLREQPTRQPTPGDDMEESSDPQYSSASSEQFLDEISDFTVNQINVSQDRGPSGSRSPAKGHGVPPHVIQQVERALGREIALKFAESMADIQNTAQQLRAGMDTACFHRRVFAKLPAQRHTTELTVLMVSQIQTHGVLFKTESFLQLLNQQHVAGPDNCADDPSRWAIVNAIFAKSILCKTSDDSATGLSSPAWGYFKNAFAMFPELMIQGEELSACEAMLAMSMFMLGSSDARTTSQLTAAAARLVHGLGLHQKGHYLTLDEGVARRHRDVFWVTYILNTEVMHRYGLPSPFGNSTVDVDLPDDSTLRYVAGLAVIQSQIYDLLHLNTSRNPGNYGPLDPVDPLFAIYEELQAWKHTLPEHLRPRENYSGETLDTPLATLHYKFYSCTAKIHTAVARLISHGLFEPIKNSFLGTHEKGVIAELSRNLCAGSARDILNILRCLASHHLSQFLYVCRTCNHLLLLFTKFYGGKIYATPSLPSSCCCWLSLRIPLGNLQNPMQD